MPIASTIDLRDPFFASLDFEKEFNSTISPAFVKAIREKLTRNGILVVDNIDIDEQAFVDLTNMMGEAINLPNFLVPAKIKGHPEIARVANFGSEDGIVNPNYAFGFYWHHDGEFWEPHRNHIINLLYSKIVPEKGGKTGFIHTRKAYDSLGPNQKTLLADLNVTVNPKNIEDFRNISDDEITMLPGKVTHSVVQKSKSSENSLYIPFFEKDLQASDGSQISHEDLLKLVDREEFKYFHAWKPNQMVLWDNLQCMHRAMGDIVGKRLLWRAQSRILDK